MGYEGCALEVFVFHLNSSGFISKQLDYLCLFCLHWNRHQIVLSRSLTLLALFFGETRSFVPITGNVRLGKNFSILRGG